MNQSQFFYSHSHLYVQKNMPSEHDESIKNLKFLILIMQIIYLYNVQWLASSIKPNQTDVIKTLSVMCGGMLIFISITIYLTWVMRYEKYFDENYPHIKNSFNTNPP